MQQDATALVKQAQRDARDQLARSGRVLPGAYLLVTINPQTGARLTHPTALASAAEQPFASPDEYREFIAMLRAEALRLGALAAAIGGEARAEVESEQGVSLRRVWYLRLEDETGVHQLHAEIAADDSGELRLGELQSSGDAQDDLDAPLLAPRAP